MFSTHGGGGVGSASMSGGFWGRAGVGAPVTMAWRPREPKPGAPPQTNRFGHDPAVVSRAAKGHPTCHRHRDARPIFLPTGWSKPGPFTLLPVQ